MKNLINKIVKVVKLIVKEIKSYELGKAAAYARKN